VNMGEVMEELAWLLLKSHSSEMENLLEWGAQARS